MGLVNLKELLEDSSSNGLQSNSLSEKSFNGKFNYSDEEVVALEEFFKRSNVPDEDFIRLFKRFSNAISGIEEEAVYAFMGTIDEDALISMLLEMDISLLERISSKKDAPEIERALSGAEAEYIKNLYSKYNKPRG